MIGVLMAAMGVAWVLDLLHFTAAGDLASRFILALIWLQVGLGVGARVPKVTP